jgi:hypothetical protein
LDVVISVGLGIFFFSIGVRVVFGLVLKYTVPTTDIGWTTSNFVVVTHSRILDHLQKYVIIVIWPVSTRGMALGYDG